MLMCQSVQWLAHERSTDDVIMDPFVHRPPTDSFSPEYRWPYTPPLSRRRHQPVGRAVVQKDGDGVLVRLRKESALGLGRRGYDVHASERSHIRIMRVGDLPSPRQLA